MYAIAAEIIEDTLDSGIEHACVIADTNYGMRSSFRAQFRDLGESYVHEIEPGRPFFVSEALEVVETGPTRCGPPRKYPIIPERFDAELAGEIADELYDEVLADVTWNQGTKGKLSGSFFWRPLPVVTNVDKRRVGDKTCWLLLQ